VLGIAAISVLVAGVALLGIPAAVASGGATPYTTLSVDVGSYPVGVAVDKTTDTVYVAAGPHTVSVIDGAINKVSATLTVHAPSAVAVDEATETVYVTNAQKGTVSVIDGTTDKVTATITVGDDPIGVAVDEATDTVYVANTESGTVSVIDGATNKVTATVTIATGTAAADSVAVDEITDTVYVTNGGLDTVSVIDGATCNGTDAAGCAQTPPTISVGDDPFGVAVDETTDTVYVTNYVSSGTVSVIDGATNTVTHTVPVGTQPYGVTVDQTTDTIYATNSIGSGTVSVIDGATNTVTHTVPVGSYPEGVAVDETTHTIYAANYESGTVSVIIPASVCVSPTSGHSGKSVTVSGRGFNPGETVKITYKTGLASPKSVTVCTATSGSDTSYSCSGTIPPTATAGAKGSHKIVAKGLTSGIKVNTAFTLT
jgi:YVTN family beta-propeller protein